MQGPISIDPRKLAAAKAAYQSDMDANQPQLIDGAGTSHAVSPFDQAADGSATFNSWTDGANRYSAQSAFVDDTEIGRKGERKTVRRPAWQSVPEYYNDEARTQFDYTSEMLKSLQGKGFKRMQSLYNNALGKIG